jgi:2-polyprenyl-3-methyl-5-hydroxy-6-metoxy-1,4-benzoquinol methylase
MDITNREWEKFGKNDPYYGVLTDEKFKTKNLTDANRNLFFATGENYTEVIFSLIEAEIGVKFNPRRSLDFGCGVGRLTIPLAKRSNQIMGVDVSESVLKEAKKNAELFGISNADYRIYSDDLISSNKFDFINTYIVLQHIPVKTGSEIVKNMLSALEEDGIAVIHITFSNENLNKVVIFKRLNILMKKSYVINSMYKLFRKLNKGKSFSEPVQQMNYYDLNKIFKLMYDFKCVLFHNEFTMHDGVIGNLMFIRKSNRNKLTFPIFS